MPFPKNTGEDHYSDEDGENSMQYSEIGGSSIFVFNDSIKAM